MAKRKKQNILDGHTLPLPAVAAWIAKESALFHDDSPFRANFVDGDPRLLLITGGNASGKSLAFRVAAQIVSEAKIEAITVSIRERTESGMRRAFMFGDERESSTGAISAGTVEMGFKTLYSRQSPAIIGLDDPEIGLSDGYACGCMVVTHSRRLAAGIVKGLKATPAMLTMEDSKSVPEWIASQETRTVAELLNLKDISNNRRRAVSKLLND